ncbi:MAG: hypothetical protein Q4C95_05030 [Planctomycetia bacterium]|nr:hypothetical protein [Planctomycetia bacterium]
MQHKLLLGIALLLSVVLLVGCSGKPSGFPSVSPCIVNVTNGGTPIADVEVALYPATPMSSTIVGGKTDATGKCVVQTTFANFSKEGAPQGEFVVTLKKDPEPSMARLTVEEMENMERSEIDDYNKKRDAEIAKMEKIIPVALTKKDSSSLKVSVSGETTLDVDVSQY